MRHMRSRRILAMLLALSMIFGLLTTTALADNEVDQNTSNVEENAANGTSEGGSGEGQSSGASDGQPSQETNKEDVSTEEETIPEEKKTTSSEEVDTQAGEGKTPVEETTYVASIGEQGYASLDAAIQAADSGATVTLLGDVELTDTLTISNKDITLDVDSNTLTVSVSNGDGIVVENATLTLASSGTGKYVFKCSARNSDGIYVNNTDASTTSTLNLNGDVEINVQASVNSAIHAYATAGNAIVNINGGKITATGSGKQFKAIHVDQNATLNMAGGELDITVDFDSYSDNNDVVGVLIFGNSSKQENCHVVISDGIFKVGGKNAFAQVVQVGMVNGYSENCDVSITGGTVKLEPTENGTGYVYAPYKASYATAAISGGTVTGTVTALVNAYISDVTNDGLTVTGGTFPTGLKDSIEKHLGEGCTMDANGTVSSSATPATGVATVGSETFDTLEKAFAALNSTNHTLTLLDDTKWDAATPVYWKAGNGEYSAAASLVEALTAAYKANADAITIICRPNADVGEMTHGHVADNLTIYGNKAYISAGECDLEVDTYKYDRSTGKQVKEDGEYLTKDITITAYELDNLGVWGERHTEFTVNVNLTDCDGKEIDGKTNVQRVYISGTTGTNNITLSGCDFVTKATSVYSNADGVINITDCSFTGAQVPVNFNHKANGEQTVTVKNSTFTNCGDTVEWPTFAAPVRFVNSGNGTQSATVDTCTFTETVGSNGDILIGDGRLNQQSNNVSLTVTNTEATVMAQKPGYYKDDGTTDNALKGEKKLTASESLTNASIDSLIGGTTATKGSETNPYTLEELGKMTRAEYIAAQTELNGTMYVTVGDYSYDKDGVLGNGVRNDTPGQTEDRNVLNGYNSNGYLGEKNDGANGLNIIFVNGSITSGVTGYESIDKIGTSLLLAVPAYTNVTFEGITFKNVMSFNYQLYTGPWSQLGELKFDGCTFNGIIVGAIAAQTLTFNSCTFENYKNQTSPNSSNPTWIRPAYGNWTPSDNKGQGSDFRSLTTINFTNNTVTSTRPVKFEYISQWNNTTTLTATGNTFDISAQDGDMETKNVGLYIGPHTDKNAVNLVLDNNTKTGDTAALYVIPSGMSKLPVGSTVKDSSDKEITITDDALEWKTNTKVTLKTEKDSTGTTNVAKVGNADYATLEAAVDSVTDTDNTITLLTDVIQNTSLSISKSLTLNLNGHKIYNTVDIWHDSTGDDDPNIVSLISIDGGASVTITGNGTIDAKENDCYTINVVNGELTIENGTFYGNISVVQVQKGKLTVKDGTFDLHQKWEGTNKYLLNCIDVEFASGAAAVAIYGGTFVDFDPNVSPEKKDENGNVPSFAAPGVGIEKKDDGTFSAASGMVAQILDASGNSVKAYKTLAEAFAEASEGQTVRLLADAKEDVEITKNITLDLGGKTLTNTDAGHATITIANGATATVKNGSVVGGTSYYNIQNNGTATFEGLTATAGNTGSSMIDNVGTLTITSGEYTGGLDTIKNEPNAKLTVDGGTFTLTKGTSKGFTGVIFNYGELTINDGTFIQSDKSAPYGQAQVIHTDKSGSNAPSTVIKGGTFKNLCTAKTAWTVRESGSLGVTKISGGTFNKKVQETYCADGFIPTKNADGTYGVKEGKYVATVDSTGYETLAAAVKAKINGKTVTLLDDVAENIEIAKAKNFTLDLNGHTINGGTGTAVATIKNCGTVTITDSSAAKTGTIKRDDNGTVGEKSYYVIRNIGTMTIEQAIVTNNSGYRQTNPSGSMQGSSLICNGDDDLGGTLNISGGTFEQQNFLVIKNGALGTLNVTGGTFTSKHSAIQNWFKANITGGEIKGQLWTDSYKAGESDGKTVFGGNATFTGEIVMDIYGNVPPTLEITGGKLDVTNWRITTAASKAGAKPAVSGGTFSSAIPYEYCAEGYIPEDKGDGKYGVKEGTYVAEVNGKQYETLQAAIDAASKNQTVKLIADTTENVTMKTPYLTLDLNGHTLNGGQVKGTPALTVTARVTVMDSSADQTGTIKREDTAKNSGVSSHYVIDVQGAGWLTFESGNVINNSGIPGVKGASLVRVGDDTVAKYPGLNIKGGNFQQDNFIAIKVDRGDLFLNGGTITSENSYAIENWFRTTIKGGTVNGTVSTWVYSNGKAVSQLEISGGTVNGNVASVTYDKSEGKKASVSITGGTVTGTLGTYSYNNGLVPLQDPAKATIGVTGGTFDIDPTPYVVEGSTVKKNSEGKYGVEKAYLAKVGTTSYYTMDEAFKAQTASGEAIVLLRDYTTGSSFPSGSINRTVDLDGHTWTYTGSDVNSAAFEVNHPNVMLTVKNGTVVSNSMVGLIPTAIGGTIKYPNSGLVFEKVEATANGHSGIETNGGNESVSVTLKDSTLNVPNGFGIYFPSSGTLTIDNSKITAKTLGVQVCSGSLDIKGAETKIEVTGDGVEKTENDGAIQDGAAISIVNRAGYKGLDKITVTGGTFKAKSGNAAVKAYNWANQAESDFTESNKVAISGGTFSSAVAPEYCAEGFEPKDNGDGTYGVQPDGNVAEIGSVKYASLAQALAAATADDTIKLLKDTQETGVFVTNGTLDLNGKTLTATYLFATGHVIDSTDGTGKLVVGQKNVLFQKNEMYLPLYDGTGYRFFQYQIVTGKLTKESATSVKARLQLKFTNADAYTLLINDSTGAHGMALNLIISWNAIRTQDQNWRIGMPNTVLSSTLNAMRNAGVDPSERFFTLTINGVNVLGSGETLYAKAGLTNSAWPGTSEAAYGSEVSIAIN